ncbi:MAG: DUF4340 domain-containing protein [Porcipelethomonas sp.]
MKNNVKALVACAAALAIAGGGYAALMLTEDDDASSKSSGASVSSESSEQTADIPVPLTSFEAADVTLITVENENGTYDVVPAGSPAEDGTVEMTVKGFEDLDVDKTMTSSILNNAKTLTADSTVEEDAQDLEKYGLKSPRANFTITAGGERKTIYIGDESPVKGETYCMSKGSNTVYTAATSSISVFLNDDTYCLSKTILEKPADEEAPIIEKITIKRTDLDYDMVIEYDKSTSDGTTSGTMATHYMTAPIFAYLDPEKSQEEVAGLFGLAADSIVTAHPTEEEINAAGFEKPFCTVNMECDDGSSYELSLGNKLDTENGSYYTAMFTDKDVIYAIGTDSLCWSDVVPDDIISRMVFGTYVWDIGKLEITANGETVRFSGKGTDKKDYKVTKNGSECSSERFQDFYSFLLKTSAEEFAIDEKAEGDPQVKIYLETQNGKTKQTVEFYKADGKKSLICVNGQPSFKCRTAFVELLIENLSKFDGSEEFVENW